MTVTGPQSEWWQGQATQVGPVPPFTSLGIQHGNGIGGH